MLVRAGCHEALPYVGLLVQVVLPKSLGELTAVRVGHDGRSSGKLILRTRPLPEHALCTHRIANIDAFIFSCIDVWPSPADEWPDSSWRLSDISVVNSSEGRAWVFGCAEKIGGRAGEVASVLLPLKRADVLPSAVPPVVRSAKLTAPGRPPRPTPPGSIKSRPALSASLEPSPQDGAGQTAATKTSVWRQQMPLSLPLVSASHSGSEADNGSTGSDVLTEETEPRENVWHRHDRTLSFPIVAASPALSESAGADSLRW